MKGYDKNKESSYFTYWDVNNSYGWAMLQKLRVNKFEWIENNSQFNEYFIKSFNEEMDEGYFLEVDDQYPEKLHELHNDLPFLSERIKIEKFEKPFTQIVNKPVYLGSSILDLSKTVMYEFWYDYVKSKYSENTKLCYMDTESFIVHVKTDVICKDIAEDVETRFDTSNFELDIPLPKDELFGQIMKKLVGLKTKTNSYLKHN